MRRPFSLALVLLLAAPVLAQEQGPTLGQLAQKLAQTPGALDALLDRLEAKSAGSLPLSPEAREKLKAMAAKGDFTGLDREPRVTVAELGAFVEAAALKAKVDGPAAVGSSSQQQGVVVERLGIPTGLPLPVAHRDGKDLGYGVTTGGSNLDADLREHYPDSQRLAAVLEKLAMNRPGSPTYRVRYAGEVIDTPEQLMAAFKRTGHVVEVIDRRRVANFADLEAGGKSVAAPLWVRSGHVLADGTEVTLPAPHAELVTMVRGPQVNADVTFFNGVDTSGAGNGGVHFRAAGERGTNWWVGGKVVNDYKGDDAVEAVRLMGLFHREAWDLVKKNELPFQGYFKLGVCATAPAIVELKLRGKTTGWPLTQDASLFTGDGEIDQLVRALPRDGEKPADAARLLAAAPWTDLKAVPFADVRHSLEGLQKELDAQHAPAQQGPKSDAKGPGMVDGVQKLQKGAK